MSIRLRLTLLLTILLAAVMLLLSALVYRSVSAGIRERFDQNLVLRAQEISPRIGIDSAGGWGNSLGGWETTGSSMSGETSIGADPAPPRPAGRHSPEDGDDDDGHEQEGPELGGGCLQPGVSPSSIEVGADSLYAQVYDACQQVAAISDNMEAALPIEGNEVQVALYGGAPIFTVETLDGDVRVAGEAIGSDRKTVGALFVGMSTDSLEADLQRLRGFLLAVTVGTIGAVGAIAWLLSRKAMEPVDAMTTAARNIAETGDISLRLEVPEVQDEIGRLAVTFNEMLEQIDGAFSSQREFLADASHELRTPLTAIRANVESLVRNPATDPQERQDVLLMVEREVDRMARLVDELLTLARADAGRELPNAAVALDSILLEVYNQQRAQAGRTRLELGEFETAEVLGNADQLKQLVLNLVDNALRYTPQGGTVRLSLERVDGMAKLAVADTGPGIAPDDLERIFERFYRVDKARSRQSGGTGLGLSISQEIARSHGGEITVVSTPGIGSTFTVVLPLLGPEILTNS